VIAEGVSSASADLPEECTGVFVFGVEGRGVDSVEEGVSAKEWPASDGS